MGLPCGNGGSKHSLKRGINYLGIENWLFKIQITGPSRPLPVTSIDLSTIQHLQHYPLPNPENPIGHYVLALTIGTAWWTEQRFAAWYVNDGRTSFWFGAGALLTALTYTSGLGHESEYQLRKLRNLSLSFYDEETDSFPYGKIVEMVKSRRNVPIYVDERNDEERCVRLEEF
ncbi:hypothetical protein L218DRAFT_947014 [Marasmius fiardii PR-910]|nr:hypothetical protein L218DRAFT_947014 [Marasmius fiardii PR-910]